jgi:hypothetical protein
MIITSMHRPIVLANFPQEILWPEELLGHIDGCEVWVMPSMVGFLNVPS